MQIVIEKYHVALEKFNFERISFMLIGWLSPDGEFFPCDSFSHSYMAQDIVEEKYPGQLLKSGCSFSDDFLFLNKWASLSYDYFFFFTFPNNNMKDKPRKITDQQIKFIGENTDQFTDKQKKDISDIFRLQDHINKRGGFDE